MSSHETLELLANLMRRRKSDTMSAAKPVFWLGAGCSFYDGVPLNDQLLDRVLAHSTSTWGSRQFKFDQYCKNERVGEDRAAFLRPFFSQKLRSDSPYRRLVRLARAGYLDLICTFNIDDLIDQALKAEAMVDTEDHLIIDVAKTLPEAVAAQIENPTGPRIRVLKLHGDYRSGFNYMTSGEIAQYDPAIDAVVRQCSRRMSVICGYSFYHLNVLNSFSRDGGPIFYVNRDFPEAPMVLSLMDARSRDPNFIDAPLGMFDMFTECLSATLTRSGSP